MTEPQPDTTNVDTAPGSSRRRPVALLAAGGAAVVLLVVAAVLLFTIGPLSPTARDERAAADAVRGLGASTTFSDFNSRMCEKFRMPQSMIDTIVQSQRQTGTDIDTMFRDQTMSKFPKDLEVHDVTVDGDTAVAHTRSAASGTDETVHLAREGGEWKICER